MLRLTNFPEVSERMLLPFKSASSLKFALFLPTLALACATIPGIAQTAPAPHRVVIRAAFST